MKFKVTARHSPKSYLQAAIADNVWSAESDKLREAIIGVLGKNPPLPLLSLEVHFDIGHHCSVKITDEGILSAPTVDAVADEVRGALELLIQHGRERGLTQ